MRMQHGPQRARDFGPLRVSILGLALNVNWLGGWWMEGFPTDQVANTALIASCHLTVCLYSLLLTFKEFIKTSLSGRHRGIGYITYRAFQKLNDKGWIWIREPSSLQYRLAKLSILIRSSNFCRKFSDENVLAPQIL